MGLVPNNMHSSHNPQWEHHSIWEKSELSMLRVPWTLVAVFRKGQRALVRPESALFHWPSAWLVLLRAVRDEREPHTLNSIFLSFHTVLTGPDCQELEVLRKIPVQESGTLNFVPNYVAWGGIETFLNLDFFIKWY